MGVSILDHWYHFADGISRSAHMKFAWVSTTPIGFDAS